MQSYLHTLLTLFRTAFMDLN